MWCDRWGRFYSRYRVVLKIDTEHHKQKERIIVKDDWGGSGCMIIQPPKGWTYMHCECHGDDLFTDDFILLARERSMTDGEIAALLTETEVV